MKRTSSDPPADSPAKRAAVGEQVVAVEAVARLLCSHAPGLCAPAPRKAFGLDRLVLDGQWAEGSVRSLLSLGGASEFNSAGGLAGRSILSVPGAGEGLAIAAGLAISQRHMVAVYGQPGFPLFEHRVFVLCSSAALQPGVAGEACSLAGHLQLSSLVVVCCWRGDGEDAEAASKRFAAYSWSVVQIPSSVGAEAALQVALEGTASAAARAGPTLIIVHTATCGSEGSTCDSNTAKDCVQRGAAAAEAWDALFKKHAATHPEAHEEIARRFRGELPAGWRDGMPEYAVGERAQATRQYGAKVLASLVTAVPEMVGGSADLTGSNLTNQGQLKDIQKNRPGGRYIRFGVREHAMIGISTGLAAYGGFLPFCGTFLNFMTYGWGALRYAARSSVRVIYVATHDSIELGEDGPTHQPIEVIAACRALPNLVTIRPADGPETVGAYEFAVQRSNGPVLLALSRSGTPHLEGSKREHVARGGYVLSEYGVSRVPIVVLAASGTEVATCMEAKEMLEKVGIGVRVVSMPSWELFEEQEEAYRRSVFFDRSASGMDLPDTVRPLRVYVEASSTLGFHRYADIHVGMTTFGASAAAKDVRKHFGFEKNAVASKTVEALKERGLVESYRIGRFGFCKFGAVVRAAMTA
eukprot:gnl/TRDRNA2_/TRDRNA2_111689_c1_seq1.p1 gnl/TRDRNA2_/TRDRNA2_111689_c1~~gnl/TRDRNA2_/TRDRNA2_111689_c1_seq1.p1  ORF type:complete len:639 (+),score=82.83 gnl/TRDRNA2_/TRDRNA2_111689_c1_seq1:36-1952(+)